MGDTYLETANISRNLIRFLLSFLDRPAYWLLGTVYELFFNVASADLFANDTVLKFYGRVQLILGVFMMFQLALTILRGIVNPDSFTDSKTGAGNLVIRIITALLLLTTLMPIGINPSNEYETQIHNNGLLFGTLYSLQHRLLSNNTIGRLVLGVDSDSSNYLSPKTKKEELQTSARTFTSTILKGFYRINLLPEADRKKHEDGKDDAIFNENRVCQDIDDKVLAAYTRVDADPGEIIGMVNETCVTNAGLFKNVPLVNNFVGSKMYAFSYMPIVSMLAAFIFAFILLSFTVDVAVRAVKLAVLRLIAPIPIISYMDPKGSKDSAFNAWVKTLTSTYLDLFIRLASVYFVLFLIEDIIKNGLYINNASGLVGILSFIIICIGLFVFARQAPKFIKEVLGLKNEPGNLFSGLSTIVGLGGAVGSGFAAARASRLADETREAYGQTDIFGRPVNPNSLGNRAKHVISGIAGGFAGAATGISAGVSAKDHNVRAAMDAIQKRNASLIRRGNDGSTMFGRLDSGVMQYFAGDGLSAAGERQAATIKARNEAMQAVDKRVAGEMVKQTWTFGTGGERSPGVAFLDLAGNALTSARFNHKSFVAAIAEAQAAGRSYIEIDDETGTHHQISVADADMMKGTILKNNEDDYIRKVTSGTQSDTVLMGLIQDAEMKGGSAYDATTGTSDLGRHGTITSRDDYKKTMDQITIDLARINRENTIRKANDEYAQKK